MLRVRAWRILRSRGKYRRFVVLNLRCGELSAVPPNLRSLSSLLNRIGNLHRLFNHKRPRRQFESDSKIELNTAAVPRRRLNNNKAAENALAHRLAFQVVEKERVRAKGKGRKDTTGAPPWSAVARLRFVIQSTSRFAVTKRCPVTALQ